MTAQHQDPQPEVPSVTPDSTEGTDPIGPITLPKRSRMGARATALVGAVGLSTFAMAALQSGIPWTTVSAPH